MEFEQKSAMKTNIEKITKALQRCQRRFSDVNELRKMVMTELRSDSVKTLSTAFKGINSMPEIYTEEGVGICIWDQGTRPISLHVAKQYLSQECINCIFITGTAEWIVDEKIMVNRKEIYVIKLFIKDDFSGKNRILKNGNM